MSLFQTSVIKKHLQVQDNGTLEKAYIAFVDYFHHPDIQRNIRASKEEQFQEGFLRELFVNILGYTLNPQPNFNLTTELKNEKGAKKTDGAILSDGNALAVIELKGSNTTDLEKVNAQAFNYKNNQTGCVYVIISNFEKLRFFIHNAVEHIEFNLFTLTKDEFNLLYFCLSADTLLAGLPEKAKYESVIAEKDITKQLYQDYAAFKSDIWLSLTKNATNKEALLLYKKTQKLLDRFLFILFSEDSGILPPNSISRIEKRWRVLKEEDAYKPLYDIFKQFFGYINEGRESNTTSETIFAYNGGLFLPDDILDNAMFDDGLLHTHIMKLTSYDFQSDIDVNILGHIFENSLNDVDQIKAHINGTTLDKKNTKRKDDGVFYTERYITKFIVDKTVGTLCEIQKNTFGVIDNEYAKGSKNRKKSIIKELHKNLGEYRDWLLTITICDPACGSGAFLNQALEYLINEHAYIDELESKLFGSGFVFRHISDHILENNIFGVDINEESIEIAKLSLWLRTAEHGRKLTSLNNNIKCGNSLVNDPDIAKDKAFNWVDEFPQVFENNGFDIVIGNPPWGANLSKPELNYVKQKHSDIVVRMINSFMFFVNMSLELVNEKGLIGVITPDVILYQKDNEKLRQKINASAHITHIVNMGDGIFEDVATACAVTSIPDIGLPHLQIP